MKKMMSHGWRVFAGIMIRMAIAAGLGVFCLTAVYLLPIEPIDAHVAESAAIFAEEGTYPIVGNRFFGRSQLDNYTDALMLLEAANDAGGSVVQRAMLVQTGRIPNVTNPVARLTSHYLDDVAYPVQGSYARYWHGYHVFLKPLLTFFNYRQIRVINSLCELCVFILLTILLVRKKMVRLIFPYSVAVFMMAPLALAKSLQFAPCYYVLSMGSIAVIMHREQASGFRQWIYLFACIGMATSYFDFLTYPLATFGMPAVFWTARQQERRLRYVLPRLLAILVGWGIGYVGLWASKWVIGSALTGMDILAQASDAIAVRTSRDSVRYVLECILRNGKRICQNPAFVLAALYVLIFGLAALAASRNIRWGIVRIAMPYLCIAALPFAWYLGATNHSHVHNFFTYRILITTVFAGMTIPPELYRISRGLPLQYEDVPNWKAASKEA